MNTLDNAQILSQSFPFFQVSFQRELGKKHFSTQAENKILTRDMSLVKNKFRRQEVKYVFLLDISYFLFELSRSKHTG